MMVGDNYGARWMKQMINWCRMKTLNGCLYQEVIRDAMIECGLKKNKMIELINEYVENEFLVYQDGKLFWANEEIKAEINIKKSEVAEKMRPYREAKEKIKRGENE